MPLYRLLEFKAIAGLALAAPARGELEYVKCWVDTVALHPVPVPLLSSIRMFETDPVDVCDPVETDNEVRLVSPEGAVICNVPGVTDADNLAVAANATVYVKSKSKKVQ